MIAHKFLTEISNNDWYQVGKFLIIKQVEIFKACHISIIKDEDTVEAIKQIVKVENGSESFIALETNFEVQNSILSK